MQPATVSTILVLSRGLCIACLQPRVRATAQSRSPRGTVRCVVGRNGLPSWDRGTGEHRQVGLSHARPYVPPLRLAGTAPQRSRSSGSPRGTLPRARQLTIRSNNGDSEPAVRREPVLHRSTCPRGGVRTACTGASHRHQASSTARIDGHSRIGVRLSCGDFSNLRVFE
jgi:hypothetical protein